VGLVLVKDLPPMPGSKSNAPMLRAGYKVTDSIAERLVTMGIKEIQVAHEVKKIDPDTILSLKERKKVIEKVGKAFTNVRESFEGQNLDKETLAALVEVSEQLTHALLEMPHEALAMSNLASADEYTHTHSVNVTALGIILAREHWKVNGWKDNLSDKIHKGEFPERLQKLGLGLLLHDVGKMKTPLSILNKPGKLDDREWEIMKRHPVDGARMLEDIVTPYVLGVIRDHHERWDGSGYPAGKSGEEIHEFSRIAAIADVYDAVTSERPYSPAKPAKVGVSVIRDGRGTAFDAQMVDVFLTLIHPYPVGAKIDLPNGQTAVVTRIDPRQPYKPFVRIKKRFTSGPETQLDLTSA
jgi:HD-GYP domain-containing protein (c-di-GMP phosphodiesterase class II)